MSKFTVLLVLLTSTWIGSFSVPFHDCGSEYELSTIDIEDCVSLPCFLTIGRKYNISMGLTANSKTGKLGQTVYVILRTIYKKIEVTPNDACNQIACPINDKLSVNFSSVITISPSLVPLDGELYWSLSNENEKQVVCMRTPIVLRVSNS